MQRARSFLHGLRLGLFSASPLTTAIMLVVSGVLLLFLLVAPPRIMLALLHAYPGISRANGNLSVFMRAIETRESKTTNPVLFFLGASTLKLSLESEKHFADALAARGVHVDPVDLTSVGQPFWYGRQLLETAAYGREGIVVVSVTHNRILGHPNTWKRDQLFEPPLYEWSMTGSKDRAAFLHQHLVADHLVKDINSLLRRKTTRTASKQSLDKGGRRAPRVRKHRPDYRDRRLKLQTMRYLSGRLQLFKEEFVQAIVSMKTNLDAHGKFKIILVDSPINPVFDAIPGIGPVLERHRDWLANLAARLDADLLFLSKDVGYQETDFTDHSHLRTRAAVRKTSDILATKIASVWKERP